jgi:SAM-dependent methyltransferase
VKKYLFGDSDTAARRLEVLAEVFAGTTRTFLLDAVTARPDLALDLGCGPGFTTHFLADVLRCKRAIGIDSSEHFIALADRTETRKVSFCLYDVTHVPFPTGPADLLFCRFLLTHLKDPEAVVGAWATQLRPKGLMMMEEVEWIDTSNRLFTTYLGIVERMLAEQSNRLYIGPVLETLVQAEDLENRMSRVVTLRVPNHLAATMFFMNLQSWKQQPFIQASYPPETIEQLERDLEAVARTRNDKAEIEWGLRQIALERKA